LEPPRATNFAPQRQRPPELDADDEPFLRAPARVQHHAQDAVDAEPGMPEAEVSSRSHFCANYYFFSSQAFQKKGVMNVAERKSPRSSLRTTSMPKRSPNLIWPTSS